MTRAELTTPSTIDGSTRCASPSRVRNPVSQPQGICAVSPRPKDGIQPNSTANIQIRKIAVRKIGIERPMIEPPMMSFDRIERGWMAQ